MPQSKSSKHVHWEATVGKVKEYSVSSSPVWKRAWSRSASSRDETTKAVRDWVKEVALETTQDVHSIISAMLQYVDASSPAALERMASMLDGIIFSSFFTNAGEALPRLAGIVNNDIIGHSALRQLVCHSTTRTTTLNRLATTDHASPATLKLVIKRSLQRETKQVLNELCDNVEAAVVAHMQGLPLPDGPC